MHIAKHLSKTIGFLFAMCVLYYTYTLKYRHVINYDYQDKGNTIPNFSQIHDSQKRKRAFIQYLSPFIVNENIFLQQIHNHVIQFHQQFFKTHSLTPWQLFWLNFYYTHSIPFNPYKNSTWTGLINKTNTVPSSIILYYAKRYSSDIHNQAMINQYNNPLLMRKPPDNCPLPLAMVLGENQPWIQLVECYAPSRLSMVTKSDSQKDTYSYIHYPSLRAAFEDFIWTINTNPAYAAFRDARANNQLEKNASAMKKARPLADPDRLYNYQYYIPQS